MELIYIFRLFTATVLGFLIGFERKMRFKEAGMRTHSIVSLGACLLTLISAYGFPGGDAGRVAAQIVSGIGFLGAGMIMFKQDSGMHGLTTAAGIWTTAGVGMAVGIGMYHLALGATVMIISLQCFLHLPIKIFGRKRYYQIKLVYHSKSNETEFIKEIFGIERFTKLRCSADGETRLFEAIFNTDKYYDDTFISSVLANNKFIDSIERTEDY